MTRALLAAISLAAALPAAAVAADALPPGVDASALSPAQRQVLQKVLDESFCHCGCPHTLAGCLKEHKSCKHAPRMAALAVRLSGTGAQAEQVRNFMGEYYASFDAKKRAKLSVKDLGAPIGDPGAAITIVEFSDFTCPFCQLLRPVLERWVKARGDRVKLHYKPFPILSHPRAMESAEAAEFAREKGKFWPMHDLLFENHGKLADDDLAGYAARLGLSGDELRQALAAKRFRPRIFAAQAEARAAGLQGTPTLYLNGRRHMLVLGTREDPLAFAEWGLDFSLADEEEWQKNGGSWARD